MYIYNIYIYAHTLPYSQAIKKHVETFNFLAQFPFTTSKKELEYYHQKLNVRVVSRFGK